MQHSNVIRGRGVRTALTDEEVRRRYEMVRALKDERGGLPLSDDELDKIIPPVDSRRTRLRARGGTPRAND
jgi:hypothetical protein